MRFLAKFNETRASGQMFILEFFVPNHLITFYLQLKHTILQLIEKYNSPNKKIMTGKHLGQFNFEGKILLVSKHNLILRLIYFKEIFQRQKK